MSIGVKDAVAPKPQWLVNLKIKANRSHDKRPSSVKVGRGRILQHLNWISPRAPLNEMQQSAIAFCG
jgi:hypothetical protein